MVITANELKTKGISVVEEAMKTYSRAVISVRGKRKYIMLPLEDYETLQEDSLTLAIRESEEDIKNGRYTVGSVEDHLKEVGIL